MADRLARACKSVWPELLGIGDWLSPGKKKQEREAICKLERYIPVDSLGGQGRTYLILLLPPLVP